MLESAWSLSSRSHLRAFVKGLSFGNVVDKKCTNSASVISAGDGSVPLLASSVPDLSLDRLSFHLRDSNPVRSQEMKKNIENSKKMKNDLSSSGGEFDADGWFRFQAELVPGESRQDVRFADT